MPVNIQAGRVKTLLPNSHSTTTSIHGFEAQKHAIEAHNTKQIPTVLLPTSEDG
jgi:hypothetical protein